MPECSFGPRFPATAASGGLNVALPHDCAENARLTVLLAERDAEIARLREALSGMLESYELCMGDELAFSDLTKDMLRGAFINEPARARAAIAARGGEV